MVFRKFGIACLGAMMSVFSFGAQITEEEAFADGAADMTNPASSRPASESSGCVFKNTSCKWHESNQDRAFDDKDDRFIVNGKSVSIFYTWGSIPVVIQAFSIKSSSGQSDRAPEAFALYGSNGDPADAGTWVDLSGGTESATGWSPSGETRYYSCNPRGLEFSSYILDVTDNISNQYTQGAELQFIGRVSAKVPAIQVAGNPGNYDDGSVQYGVVKYQSDLTHGAEIALKAPADPFLSGDEQHRYRCTGWKLYTFNEETQGFTDLEDEGTSLEATISYDETKRYNLEWQFEVAHRVTTSIHGSYGGTITPATRYVVTGQNLTLTATPDEGSRFVRWLTDGTLSDVKEATAELKNVTAPMEVAAAFWNARQAEVTQYVKPDGLVKGDGETEETAKQSISSAVNFLNGYQEGVLYILPGTYAFTSSSGDSFTLSGAIRVTGLKTDARDEVVLCKETASNGERLRQPIFHLNHPQAVVENLVLRGGYSTTDGRTAATVAFDAGGGTMRDCILEGATMNPNGIAAAVYMASPDARMTRCIIRNATVAGAQKNMSERSAAAVFIEGGMMSDCLIYGCSVFDGLSQVATGGIGIQGGRAGMGVPQVINCTVLNCAGTRAGGIFAEGNAVVANTVVAGCTTNSVCQSYRCDDEKTTTVACASDDATAPQGWLSGTTESFFVKHAVDADGKLDFAASDLRPLPRLMNKGVTQIVHPDGDMPATLPVSVLDLAGKPRVQGPAPDIGAYEFRVRGFFLSVR